MDKPISVQLSTGEVELLNRLEETALKKGIPRKIIQLRQSLALKAKREPKFRFYSLFGQICSRNVLEAAWELVKKNNGAPGIDNVTIGYINNTEGIKEALLDEISHELKERTYKPKPIKRVFIPKSDGKLRPLGLPTIKDRIIQMAVVLVIEPIFEADFMDSSYGFRPGIGAHDAVSKVVENIKTGQTCFYDADLQAYFDSIPHDKLLACIRMRITDSSVIKLIRMWLTAPIVENSGDGTTTVTHPKKGTPQGGVISPLLSNLYLHWFDKVFHNKKGPSQTIKGRLTRFADDFIVQMRYQSTYLNEYIRNKIENWMGLTLNKEKTKIGDLKKGSKIQFLGFQIQYAKSKFGGKGSYVRITPSDKAMKEVRAKLHELTSRKMNCFPIKEIVKKVNLYLAGWTNYFKLGHPTKAFRDVDNYVGERMVKHLLRRSQRKFKKNKEMSWYQVLTKLGLIRISSQQGEAFRKAVCKKFARTV
jgi:RNA-directed DNA polymerase